MRVYRPRRKKRRNKPPAIEAASAEAFVEARRYRTARVTVQHVVVDLDAPPGSVHRREAAVDEARPVFVDNRPGAGGRVGTEVAAKAASDGYTLIMGNGGSYGINSALCRDLGIRERITTLGGEPVGNSPEAFAAIVKGDIAKWKQVAKTANITAD